MSAKSVGWCRGGKGGRHTVVRGPDAAGGHDKVVLGGEAAARFDAERAVSARYGVCGVGVADMSASSSGITSTRFLRSSLAVCIQPP
jgi:hypothetical protein